MLHVPLSEGGRVDLHDRVLSQRLRTNELLVRRVVHRVQDTSLVSRVLRWPDKVARVQSHGAELQVTTATSHSVDSLVSDLSVGSGSSQLKLPLLLVNGSASTGSSKKEVLLKVLDQSITYLCL